LSTFLSSSKEDSAKVNTLNELSSAYRNLNSDSSFYFLTNAITLATKLNYKMGIANTIRKMDQPDTLRKQIGVGIFPKYKNYPVWR